ncbi:MAG: LL-diaminopimelate aminotransferase [bacterium]
MKIERAERIEKLPPYLFAELDRKKRQAMKRGMDILSLGIGDPDIPTPSHVIEALYGAAKDPRNHQYPLGTGLLSFRQAVADWYRERFGVRLDAESEVLALIGSKEGIGHVFFAFINPGDIALVPDPGYPVYRAGTIFAGGTPHAMPLLKENGFLPDLDAISPDVARRAKLMFINYPNNPTSAIATEEFFVSVVEFAEKYNIIVCHDAAYSEIYYEERPRSFLETPGAKEVGIEFHSLSKTFNMTGWRIGFAVGNRDIILGLSTIKENLDSGVFQAVQLAGVAALKGDQTCVEGFRRIYRERRDILVGGLKDLGWDVIAPKATFYVWVALPRGVKSSDFAGRLLEQTGVVITPGVGFGDHGEGYVRFALTVDKERIREALGRLKDFRY